MLPYVIGLEVIIWLVGLVLLWRIQFSPAKATATPALAPWRVSVEYFFGTALGVTLCVYSLLHVGGALTQPIIDRAPQGLGWRTAIQGLYFQISLIVMSAIAAWYLRRPSAQESADTSSSPPPLAPRNTHPILAGVVTFVTALPVISLINLAWRLILKAFGYSVVDQDMVELFRDTNDRRLILLMAFMAGVLAPIAEEMIFRAGLFRFLRTRTPRIVALIVPAIIFASLHGNLAAFVPLCALGLYFSFAYERTGNIAVTMIAHALFNLHTILLLMVGIDN